MNFAERKNWLYRIISSSLLLGAVAFFGWSIWKIIIGNSEDKILSLVACGLATVFALLEIIIILKGGKKEISLYKIAFNENGTTNTVFLIAALIGTVLGLALFITSLVLFCTHQYEPFLTSCLVILSIGLYLLINCVDYFIFLIMYKKREYDILKYTK